MAAEGRTGRRLRHVDFGDPVVQSQENGLRLAAAGNAEIFAAEIILPSARRSPSKNSAGNNVGSVSAVALSRIQVGSSLAHADQNGSVRLHAVDNMANRACGRCARIGRSAAIRSSVSRAASSATIQPSTVRPRIEYRYSAVPAPVSRW